MLRVLFAPLLLILACLSLAEPSNLPKLKVLLIDGQNNHKWDITTPVLVDALEGQGDFEVTVSTTPPKGSPADAWAGWTPDFTAYDVVVSNYNGELWPELIQDQFDAYVKNGGGFVSVHAANNAFGEWAAYNRMIGVGGWGGRNEQSGPWLYVKDGKLYRDKREGKAGAHGPQHEFVVEIQNPDHPIVRGLPARWLHTKDELYSFLRGPAEEIEILASAKSDLNGEQEPILMVIQYGKGRVFHSTLGHADYSMLCRGFYTTLRRGTEWAATGDCLRTAAVPADFPTAEDVAVVTLEGHPQQEPPPVKP
jgi:type 1 glutamine amidotransferase